MKAPAANLSAPLHSGLGVVESIRPGLIDWSELESAEFALTEFVQLGFVPSEVELPALERQTFDRQHLASSSWMAALPNCDRNLKQLLVVTELELPCLTAAVSAA